jgi:hypothetical protein
MMKDRVMEKIKREKIRMRPASVFLAEKLGLQSALVVSILAGTLLLNIFLYFLKKTGVLKFMAFGWPGFKIILLTLPYDYIILFIITIALANFIIRKFDLPRNIRMDSDMSVLALLAVTLLLGSFFAVSGVESAIGGWSKNKIPANIAVSGRVIDSSDDQVTIKEIDGTIKTLNFDNLKDPNNLPAVKKYEKNKVLRAVGKKDKKDDTQFHAEAVECCDEN